MSHQAICVTVSQTECISSVWLLILSVAPSSPSPSDSPHCEAPLVDLSAPSTPTVVQISDDGKQRSHKQSPLYPCLLCLRKMLNKLTSSLLAYGKHACSLIILFTGWLSFCLPVMFLRNAKLFRQCFSFLFFITKPLKYPEALLCPPAWH